MDKTSLLKLTEKTQPCPDNPSRQRLALPVSLLGAAIGQQFGDFFPGEDLVLDDPVVDDCPNDPSSVIVTGASGNSVVAGLPTNVTFTIPANGDPLQLLLTATTNTASVLSANLPEFEGTVLDDLQFLQQKWELRTADAPGLTFTGLMDKANSFGSLLLNLLGVDAAQPILGSMQPVHPDAPDIHELVLKWPDLPGKSLGFLSLGPIKLSVTTEALPPVRPNGLPQPAAVLTVATSVVFGSSGNTLSLPMSCTITSGSSVVRFDADPSGLVTAGLEALAGLFNGVSLDGISFGQYKLADSLKITQLTMLVDPQADSLLQRVILAAQWTPPPDWYLLTSVKGDPLLKFAGVGAQIAMGAPFGKDNLSAELEAKVEITPKATLILSAQWSDTPMYEASLDPMESLSMRDLAVYFLGEDPDHPHTPDVRISNLDLKVTPGQSYQLTAELSDLWKVQLSEDVSLDISAVDFSFDYTAATNGQAAQTNAELTAAVQFAGADLALDAKYDTTNGWDFTTQLTKGQLNIGYLLEDLDYYFGVTPPAFVKTIAITALLLHFNPTAQQFDLTIGGEFAIRDQDKRVDISLGIHVAKQATGFVFCLDGALTIGDFQFALGFKHNSQDNLFVALYQHRSKDPAALPIHDYIARYCSSDLAAIVPAGLTIDIADVIFAFDATAGGSNNFLFMIDVKLGDGIDLKYLPLIGPHIPADDDVKLKDIQVWIEYQMIAKTAIPQFNAQLAELGSEVRLPDALDATVLIQANLLLGTTSQTLTLPIGQDAGDQQQADPTGGNGAGPDGGAALVAAGAPATPAEGVAPAAASGGSAKWFTVQKQFGPVQFERIGVAYQNSRLFFLMDMTLSFSELTLSVNGLGLGSKLTGFKPAFNLDGASVSLNNPSLTVNGGLLVVKDPSKDNPDVSEEYMGEVTVAFGDYLISAMAAYAVVKGQPSFSIFAQVEGEFGGLPAFFITGFMGGFGYNSLLALPAPEDVYKYPFIAGLNDPAVFGANPTPLHVLDTLKGRNVVTPVVGAYWIAAGLMFRSFEMVNGRALFAVTFGKELQIALLGLANMTLPQGATTDAYAYIELQLEALLKPDEGYFSISASLTPNSYLLTKDNHLTGGFAFSVWFGSNPHAGDFVITIGGYHPAFDLAGHAWYPRVAPVGFNWPVSSQLTIKGGAYFALTPSAIMAGGNLEILYQSGDLKAWFTAYANFMARWNPFWFTANIGVSVGVSYRLNLLFTTVNLSVELGATLDMSGPPVGGVVHIDWYILSFTIPFGVDAADKTLDQLKLDGTGFMALLPKSDSQPKVSLMAAAAATPPPALILDARVNRGLVRQDKATSAWIVRSDELVFTASSAIPMTAVQVNGSSVDLAQAAPGAPSSISIRPMALSDVTSTLTVSLTSVSGHEPAALAAPLVQCGSGPEALWGTPLNTKAPPPSAATVDNLPMRVQLSAADAQSSGQPVGPFDPGELRDKPLNCNLTLVPGRQADANPTPAADPDAIQTISKTLGSSAAGQRQARLLAAMGDFAPAQPYRTQLSKLGDPASAPFQAAPLAAPSA